MPTNQFQKLLRKGQKIPHIPDSVIILSLFMSYSAISQFFADIVLEGLSLAHLLPHIPLRPNFLFLAAISALLAYHALKGIQRQELDVTQDSVQVSFLVETGLLIGDIYFVTMNPGLHYFVTWARIPFMILTATNIAILSYIITTLRLFEFRILWRVWYSLVDVIK